MNHEAWREHHRTLLESAKKLRDAGDYRGATNRIYYALYSLVTYRSGKRPPYNQYGWSNPEHSQVPGMVAQISGLTPDQKKLIRQAIKDLFRQRVIADYQPWTELTKADARLSFATAYTAISFFGETL